MRTQLRSLPLRSLPCERRGRRRRAGAVFPARAEAGGIGAGEAVRQGGSLRDVLCQDTLGWDWQPFGTWFTWLFEFHSATLCSV